MCVWNHSNKRHHCVTTSFSLCLWLQVCSCHLSLSSSSSLASSSIPSGFRGLLGPTSVCPSTCSSWSSSSSLVWQCWWWLYLKVFLWLLPSRWPIQSRSVWFHSLDVRLFVTIWFPPDKTATYALLLGFFSLFGKFRTPELRYPLFCPCPENDEGQ